MLLLALILLNTLLLTIGSQAILSLRGATKENINSIKRNGGRKEVYFMVSNSPGHMFLAFCISKAAWSTERLNRAEIPF